MASTFGIFESAKSGLSVAMQQLNVTQQNISNVNTEGYTRQRILTSAKEPPISSYLIAQLSKTAVGQGVEAIGIQQIRSVYLDQQYRNLNSGYNNMASRSESLEYMTGVLNELKDAGSLTTSITKFFAALNTFSQDTSSKEYRTNVQQQALSMTQSFNNVYEEMQSLWHDQNDSIYTTVQRINAIANEIAHLNDAIASAVQTGGVANDLNDERNLLLDQLSGYVNITYSWNEDNNNMVDVKIGNQTLVEGKTANEIEVVSAVEHTTDINDLLSDIAAANDPLDTAALAAARTELEALGNFEFTPNAGGGFDVSIGGVALVTDNVRTSTIEDAAASNLTAWVEYYRNNLTLDGAALSIASGGITGGQLYSNIEMITNQSAMSPGIPHYMEQLNEFVRDMVHNLNEIHRGGYTYPDGGASLNGINFFMEPTSGQLTAGNFALSDEVLASVYNIAGSSAEVVLNNGSTQTGNNENALKMFKDLAGSKYYDKLNSIVINLAIAANSTGSIMETKHSLLASADTQRKSLSAVSLDEETTNLIVFQQAYNAAARVITTLDEMLNTMVNNMGIVGR